MPELTLAGQTFECRETLPPLRLMELASANRSGDPQTQMGGLYDFVMAAVLPEHRGRLVAAIHSLDDAEDEDAIDQFNDAVGGLMVQYADRPTQAPSQSQPGRSITGDSSRVGWRSLDGAKKDPASSKGGARAAS